jgi:hypothetical protein
MTGIGASDYSVAGYKEGDRIGAGVVVDPAKLTGKDATDTKLVTVDLNLNGTKDITDDQVVVKLPPKGTIPANWEGISKLEGGGKTQFIFSDAAAPIRNGVVIGGAAGFLATLPMVGRALSGDALGATITLPLLGMGVGAGIGALSAPEGKEGRNAMIGMGVGGATVAAIAYGVNGLPKGLGVIAAAAIVGGVICGAVSAVGKSQDVSADAQRARATSVPDIVAPKFILNQYLLKQTQTQVENK